MSIVLTLTSAESVPAGHARLLQALLNELADRDPHGEATGHLDDPREVARVTVDAVLDSDQFWEEHLGPMYDAKGVAALLGDRSKPLTRQAVSKRALLGVKTGNGRVFYPAFQFEGRQPVGGLDKVLRTVDPHLLSRWTLASWLISPERDLDNARPIDVLRSGDVDRVVAVASRWAAALS